MDTAGIDEENRLVFTGFSGVIYRLGEAGEWKEIGKLDQGRMFGRFVDPPGRPLLILGGSDKGGRSKALEFLPEDGP